MIKGIITDLDGVIFDSMHIWDDLGRRYLAEHGIEADKNTDSVLYDMNMAESAAWLNRNYLPDISVPKIQSDIENMIFRFYAEEVTLKEGAAGLLEFFAKNGLAVTAATTCPERHVLAAAERTGIRKFISGIFTSEKTGSDKNDPEIYYAASKFMGTSPAETLVLEDAVYAIRTAKAAGYVTAGIYDPSAAAYTDEIINISDIYAEKLIVIRERWPEIRSYGKK